MSMNENGDSPKFTHARKTISAGHVRSGLHWSMKPSEITGDYLTKIFKEVQRFEVVYGDSVPKEINF